MRESFEPVKSTRSVASRILRALLYAVTAYVAAAACSYVLVLQLSPNHHDRELEAAMTSVFAYGPAAAALGFIAGVIRHWR